MIKYLLRPFLKKHIGLFISMVFVSMLSIGLLIAFSSALSNLGKAFDTFKTDYGSPSAVVQTKFTRRANASDLDNIKGIDKYEFRIAMDSYLVKSDGRVITSRICSYNEDNDIFFKRYVVESGTPVDGMVNIAVTNKFAQNNNFQIGDHVKFGYYGMYVEANIFEIVETVEVISVRVSNYIMSDNTDFGYVYVSEQQLNDAIYRLAKDIQEAIAESDEYRTYYEAAKAVTGIDIPDLASLDLEGLDFASMFFNQVLVKGKAGYRDEEVVMNVTRTLEDDEIEVKSSTIEKNSLYELYMENNMNQLKVGATFLPLFFYLVTMIVIVLFINQMIKSMTSQIGTMVSIGISPRQITSVFQSFSLLMSIVSAILGVGLSIPINRFMCDSFRTSYSIPTISKDINLILMVAAILSLSLMIQIATVISCQAIYKITPKDAMISNEAKRKPLPKWLDRLIEKLPMNLKLGVNSIAQNTKRFVVSTFAIFSAFVLILLANFFGASKDELIKQSFEVRLPYDCQIYASQKVDNSFKEKLEAQDCITDVNECYFTYLEVSSDKDTIWLETMAVDKDDSNMIYIPSSNGKKQLATEDEGIILSTSDAKRLGVKVGDKVTINGVSIKVTGISLQYFHFTEYMSKGQMDALGVSYISSYVLDVNDEKALLNYLADNENKCLTVFSHSLQNDLNNLFKAVNIIIVVLSIFSILMGLIILIIMSQNSLMEQQRPISVMRAIGFRVKDVSNLWILQSASQLLVSTVFAIPSGVLLSVILFRMCSSARQTYPFVFKVSVVLMAFGFILAVIVITHLLAMFSIKRWNLADNTRSRE